MPDSRYRITERVASGGMAEVFKGVAESLQGFRKNIAIKRILPALTQNKKFVAMFLDEARLSLALQHANVVQVFDIGHADDTYFIVMEYVDGVDLKALLEWRRRLGKRVPLAITLNIINEICKALAYAHELPNPETGRPLGIVHRDISPPNVLISRQGEVKVADFGLAKATSQLETTEPGVVKGKMSYLSPEAARGEEVDRRSDIFSVGILLYELLTGKRLFYGETDFQTVELVRNAKVPPIRAQNSEVERDLEDIVRKTLAQRVEDRFQSATDLQEELAQYSYSRGLKVISRDVAEMVRQCLEDRAAESGGRRRAGSILDTLLQDEINKFTSVDFEDPGARPIGEADLPSAYDDTHGGHGGQGGNGGHGGHSGNGGNGGMNTGMVDPRGWAVEALSLPVRTGEKPESEVGASGWMSASTSAPASANRGGEGEARPGARRSSEERRSTETPGPEALASVLEPLPRSPAPAPAKSPSPAILARLALGGVKRHWKAVGLVAVLAVGAAIAATSVARRSGGNHAVSSPNR